MIINCLNTKGIPAFGQVWDALEERTTPVYVTGLSAVHKAHLIANIADRLDHPVLLLTPDESSASRICEDLNTFLGVENAAVLFPAKELVFRDVEGASREYEHTRIKVFGG